jgi:hypothetical protein
VHDPIITAIHLSWFAEEIGNLAQKGYMYLGETFKAIELFDGDICVQLNPVVRIIDLLNEVHTPGQILQVENFYGRAILSFIFHPTLQCCAPPERDRRLNAYGKDLTKVLPLLRENPVFRLFTPVEQRRLVRALGGLLGDGPKKTFFGSLILLRRATGRFRSYGLLTSDVALAVGESFVKKDLVATKSK